MTRSAWLVLGLAAVILLAFGVGIGRSCPAKPSKAERKADVVLADTTQVLEARKQRDSAIAAGHAEARKIRLENQRLKQSVKTLLDSVDHERTEAAILANVPAGSPHDSIVHLDSALTAQKQVAARLRDQVVPQLQHVIEMDSLALYTQDATIAAQSLALRAEYRRSDELTETLRNLRNDHKPGKFLGVLPSWTGKALLIAGSAYVGYKVGQNATSQ